MTCIEFYTTEVDYHAYPHPIPASKIVPSWYKDMPRARDPLKGFVETSKLNYTDPEYGIVHTETMKQCIPVRDYITSGYIIPLWSDISFHVPSSDDVHVAWKSKDTMSMAGHPVDQVMNTPIEKKIPRNMGLLKFISPWRFKTPSGYSCLFFSPYYNDSPIEILPAIVDTDSYHEVNFPFVVKKPAQEYFNVERGSPIIQVLPFRREQWTHKVTFKSTAEIEGKSKAARSFLAEAYRKFYHTKKIYR